MNFDLRSKKLVASFPRTCSRHLGLLFCMLCVLLLSGAAVSSRLAAQSGITHKDGPNLTCASDDGRRHYCQVNTSRGVNLVRQRSGSPCNQGQTWGFDRQGVWVDRGCRADFYVQAEQTAGGFPGSGGYPNNRPGYGNSDRYPNYGNQQGNNFPGYDGQPNNGNLPGNTFPGNNGQPNNGYGSSAPNDLRDLVGARAGQAELALQSRGYQNTGSNRGQVYWFNPNTNVCAAVRTSGGRYQQIQQTGLRMCNRGNGNNGYNGWGRQ